VFAKICLAILGAAIVGISFKNSHYFARAYFTHLIPLAIVWFTGRAVLTKDDTPAPMAVLLPLLAAVALSAVLELSFDVYKRHPFDENGIVTLLSVSQLLLTGFFALAVWRERRGTGPFKWNDKIHIWLLMGVGFLFLALDEKTLIHEGLDRSLHKVMEMQANQWTSRIDDFIIVAYGIIGVGALWLYSSEMKKYKASIHFLIAGFIGLALTALADTATSSSDFFTWLLDSENTRHSAQAVVGIMEEVCKVTSEALFLTWFASILGMIKKQDES